MFSTENINITNILRDVYRDLEDYCVEEAETILQEKKITENDIQSNQITLQEDEKTFTEETSSESQYKELDIMPETFDSKKEAVRYIAGWVAFKLKKKFPELSDGNATNSELNSTRIATWIDHRSLGGLMYPNDEWLQVALQLEELFINHHGPCHIQENKTVRDLLERANKFIITMNSSNEIAIETYLKLRTYIRIKEMNLKLMKGKKRVLYCS